MGEDAGIHRQGRDDGHAAATARRVLVIGAGISGLVAAQVLRAGGLQATVLEARDRTGGRLWTNHELGVPVDLGASWVHGADTNPLTAWCTTAAIQLLHAPVGERRFYAQGAFERFGPLARRAWRGLASAGFLATMAAARARLTGQAASLGAVLDPLLEREGLPLFDRRLLAWMISTSEGVEGAPANQIDLRAWYPAEANGINALPVGGYSRLVEDAAAGIEIQTTTPVARVSLTPTGVAVETLAGNRLEADAVIITVPLGVLKSGRIHFEPDLPAPKRAALERIGYGASPLGDAAMNKLVLRFEQRFWDDANERQIALPQTPAERGAYTNWINCEPLLKEPVIMGFATGAAAGRFDREADDEEIVARGLASLERLTGRKPPPPTGVLITRWLSDPWTLGSYSFNSVHSSDADRLEVARPIADRIWFAGEGTQARDYGTVQAAMRSGEEAAAALCRLLTRREPPLDRLPWRQPVRWPP